MADESPFPDMSFTTLGRTGLMVSVACLGCGGGSRLGLASGKSEAHAASIVHQAIELGVNFIDTANAYGTESAVGLGIKGFARDQLIISTKHMAMRGDHAFSAEDIVKGLDESLRSLGSDYVDVFHLHAVRPGTLDHAMTLVPALLREKERGKIRFLGITESGPVDPHHEVLVGAADHDVFDVMMLAYSLMNHRAEAALFPKTLERRIGTMIMFAVRSLFSVPGRLQSDIRALTERGELPAWFAESDDPLGFLIHEGGARTVMDACYRFARHAPGVDTVLFGTGDHDHLKTNLASILSPPLPDADVLKVKEYFGHLVGVGLDFPVKPTPA